MNYRPIVSKYGQWKYPGKETIVPTEDGSITMQGVPYPVMGIDETGDTKMMMPGQNYNYRGKRVHEIPMQQGGSLEDAKMKASMALAAQFGNTSAQRMTMYNPPTAVFKDKNGNMARGTHYMSSMDNSAVPMLQMVNGKLQYKSNANPNDAEAMNFNSAEDAQYFAEHYKNVAPMMKKYQDGGSFNAYDFLFDDEDQQQSQQPVVKSEKNEVPLEDFIQSRYEAFQQNQEEDDLAMMIAMNSQDMYRPRKRSFYSGSTPSDTPSFAPSNTPSNSKFQSFSSPEEGMNALKNQLELYKTGRTRNPVKPNSSLYEAMAVYAPASDNNRPKQYAEFIAKKLGISPSTPISQVDTNQWAEAIKIMEGNKTGNNPGNLKRINYGRSR